MKEIWKKIKGYEDLYQISNKGRVKSFKKGKERILKNGIRNTYAIIQLSRDKKRKSFQIHRLVAEAFLDNPNNLPIINHKDYNRLNNNVENLEWCTQKYNVNYSKNNMIGKLHIQKDKTYGIFHRVKRNTYEVCIRQKYYGNYKTYKEAERKRNEVLNELNITVDKGMLLLSHNT